MKAIVSAKSSAPCLSMVQLNPEGAITTFGQLGSERAVSSLACAIPTYLGDPWNTIELVWVHPQSHIGEHLQAVDEISYVLRGSGLLTLNGITRSVFAGSLVIAPRGTRHNLFNPSSGESLICFVIELKVPDGCSSLHSPTVLPALPYQMQAAETFLPLQVGQRLVKPRISLVDLARYFSAPWGPLSLVEIPAGGYTTEASTEEEKLRLSRRRKHFDENILVVRGSATVEVASERFATDEYGLNIVIPRGMRYQLTNRSSINPLIILSVLVCREG